MDIPSTPVRGRPARLDATRTVETALDLLDAHGLDALTMRRLADAVGARAGALYRYFATKQDLLTAMAEYMLADVQKSVAARPGAAGDWQDRLAGLAYGLRAALLARRDGARVFAGTHSTGVNTLGFSEAVTGVLREAGFADDDAVRALLVLANFTLGHTLEEQAVLQVEPSESAEIRRLSEAVAAGRFPNLAAGLHALASADYEAHFEFGLSLLIRGLEALDRRVETRRGAGRPS
ncbi:TetR/AcrR family transcriptional regulator [Streptomyces sp. NPDC087844]|uniref:TetR/AcrR family transcriptional regulator n=1 Tax=Streptomyces sp. NPDC087844 TaxID=3365805 RepID=UPI003828EEB9